MDTSRLVRDLDEHQRAAVTTPSTLVAVIAAAGSGKTRVLTRRIAYRVAAETADASHTLALTFTREAAGELRRRLRRSGLREPVEAGTFHSVALGLLRQRWHDTDRPAPAIVNDPLRLMGEVAGDVPVAALAAEHDWASASAIAAHEYPTAARNAGRRSGVSHAAVAAALARYDELKRRRGVIDLDDLLAWFVADMRRDPEFAAGVRWRFRHVLVDEAQDLNTVQYQMLHLLVGDRRDLFLVGDPAQAIYGFNGSNPAFLAEVDEHFPGVEVVRLPTNHRCRPQVVAAGMHVLHTSGQRADSVSAREPGPAVEFMVAADERAEAERVAVLVRSLVPRRIPPTQLAVLARTHEQLAGLRRALRDAGVPVRHDALAPGTPLAAAVRTASNLPSAARLRAWAHDIIDLPPTPGQARTATDEAEHRVATVVLEYLRESVLGDGAGFRSWVATTRPFSDEGVDEGVDLLTFHAAKGREWHTVVVTGVETGLVPHRSATTVEARAEEARLLHVAFTRASDHLVISRSERRRGYARQPSPLIAGLGDLPGIATAPVVPPPAALSTNTGDTGAHDRRRVALGDWRDATARAIGALPDEVCAVRALDDVADADPRSVEGLVATGWFGPASAALHFPAIRAALDCAVDQSERSTTTGA